MIKKNLMTQLNETLTDFKPEAKVFKQDIITPQDFDKMIQKLRGFFMQKNYTETFPQPRLSIMAACEDPKTVRGFNFGGQLFPLPQTNQMWLEYDLMKNANEIDGVYCLTASYRDEPNPIPGRHQKLFGMWEAEHKGNFEDLLQTLSEIVTHLGFVKSREDIKFFTYDFLCEHYNTETLESEHETMMWEEFGDVVGITNFPARSNPFWNMKQSGVNEKTGEKLFNKCDLIICGQETFGCAERSSNPEQMRYNFLNISDGMYAELLFNQFGEDRVMNELDEYLSLDFIPRWGFGMGVNRLLRAMKIKGLI